MKQPTNTSATRKAGARKTAPPKGRAKTQEIEPVETLDIAAAEPAFIPTPAPLTEPVICIAVDDGHSETKIAYLSEGVRGPVVTRSFPSRTARGLIEVDAQGAAGANAYRTYDEEEHVRGGAGDIIMIVPRGRSAEETGDNRTQDYPTSDRNRAVVHHALHLVAPKGARLRIGTTLPYSDFHQPVTGGHNVRLIEAKKANIAKPVRLIDRQSLTDLPLPYTVMEHGVYSEGVAAFFDCMLNLEDGALSLNEAFCERFGYVSSFAVVDVGGKTTDIVYGTWSGNPQDQPMINIAQSESLRAGVLDAADDLENRIKNEFGVRSVVDREKALADRKVPIYGQLRDIGHLVDAAIKPLATRIREAVYRHAEDGSGLAYVIFVGGGSVLLRQHLEVLFDPGLVYVPEDPRFANARGVLKLMLAEGDDAGE
ncbi:ParM/StbA family protein [Xanthobacter sp. DSM 14520]|uniref:plasmid segregation protein ParM domain-containing protein n=1 Tax=Xanthobacter autotrophicus (strain ATCC BAA-1158 / Py2) TaxID=78245 RepID=UPI00372746AB